MQRSYAEKQIVIVGAGRSGRALARYFCERGARVTLSDRRRREELGALDGSWQTAVRLDLGGHDRELMTGADLVVVSPGVPSDLPVLQAARDAGVAVLGEIEIAWRDLPAPMVGITGTNGKSTTTALCGEMFSAAGCETFVGGNLGTPLIEAVGAADWQWLVVELSSFQLETIRDFRPRYGMLLNLSEDHLDRYPDVDAYLAAKLRLFENQNEEDFAILNRDDPKVRAIAGKLKSNKIWFSASTRLDEGMFLEGRELVWRHQGDEIRFDGGELKLYGLHNLENLMAAMLPPLLEGVAPETAWRVAREFTGLPHRMQLVRKLDGVVWINDSKGTNVGSVLKSLAGLPEPITLIAGGKDKGGDFALLRPLVTEKVQNLLLLGEAAERISAELGGCCTILRCETMQEAVETARRLTPRGGTVLLSPGCASFDMFTSFEQRGEVFTGLVAALDEEEGR